jgi:UMF1 family MFS transporter
MVLIILSNTFFSYGESLTAAFLPELAKPGRMGKVSGWGWAFGYFGGMLALGICLGYVIWAQGQGIKAEQFVPVTMLITAAIYGAGRARHVSPAQASAPGPNPDGAGAGRVACLVAPAAQPFPEARRYRDFMWLLACTVFYQGGVAVAIALAAIYAEQVIGFQQQETMVLIFVLNFAAAGRFAWGYFQDRIGHKLALGITLVGWVATCVIAAITTTKGGFWYAAAIAGRLHGLQPVGGAGHGRACSRRERSWPSSMACGPLPRGWPASSAR